MRRQLRVNTSTKQKERQSTNQKFIHSYRMTIKNICRTFTRLAQNKPIIFSHSQKYKTLYNESSLGNFCLKGEYHE